MKKALLILSALSLPVLLTGCTVNWFNTTKDVPWYFIAIPIVIIFVAAHVTIMSCTYVCPKCNTEFKPKFYHFFTYVHFGNKRIAKCPKCKRTGFCKKK